jgi:hypothetical protein
MADSDKVEVYLARYSDGVRLNEFTAPPGTPKHTGDPNESYVEATTGERFQIVVKLLPGFKFLGSPKVRVDFYVDQGGHVWGTLSKKKDRFASPSDMSHREYILDDIQQFIDGQHMDCGLTFGELTPGLYPSTKTTYRCRLTLEVDDDSTQDNLAIAEEADRQGRIVVKLRRGRFASRKVVDDGVIRSFDPPEHVDTVTAHNEVVHKHHVSHTLKYFQNEPSPRSS